MASGEVKLKSLDTFTGMFFDRLPSTGSGRTELFFIMLVQLHERPAEAVFYTDDEIRMRNGSSTSVVIFTQNRLLRRSH